MLGTDCSGAGAARRRRDASGLAAPLLPFPEAEASSRCVVRFQGQTPAVSGALELALGIGRSDRV